MVAVSMRNGVKIPQNEKQNYARADIMVQQAKLLSVIWNLVYGHWFVFGIPLPNQFFANGLVIVEEDGPGVQAPAQELQEVSGS